MYVEESFGVLFVQEEDTQQEIKIKFGMRESMWGRTLGGGGGGGWVRGSDLNIFSR